MHIMAKASNIINRKSSISYRTKRKINGWIFLMPWIIGFVLFFVIPLINNIIYSFHIVSVGEAGGMEMEFNGIQNYLDLFNVQVSSNGQQFARVFVDENINILINTPVIVVFSLFAAILINNRFKGRSVARVIFFLPIVIGLKIIMDLFMVSSGGDVTDAVVDQTFNTGAILDFLLQYSFLPIEVSKFISSVANNVFSLMLQAGVQTLVLLAGLQSINTTLYEVADIEGATKYEIFWKITLPLLYNVSIFALVYTFVDLFLNSSISIEIYNFAFRKNNIGIGSALSVAYLINVLIDLVLILFIYKKVVSLSYGKL